MAGSLSANVQAADPQAGSLRGRITNNLPVELSSPMLIWADQLRGGHWVCGLADIPPGASLELNPARVTADRVSLADFQTRGLREMGFESYGGTAMHSNARFDSLVAILSTMELYDPLPKPADKTLETFIQPMRGALGRLDRSNLILPGLADGQPGKALLIGRADNFAPEQIVFDRANVKIVGPAVVRCLVDVRAP